MPLLAILGIPYYTSILLTFPKPISAFLSTFYLSSASSLYNIQGQDIDGVNTSLILFANYLERGGSSSALTYYIGSLVGCNYIYLINIIFRIQLKVKYGGYYVPIRYLILLEEEVVVYSFLEVNIIKSYIPISSINPSYIVQRLRINSSDIVT